MNKSVVAVLGIILVVLIGAYLLFGRGGSNPYSTPQPTATQATPATSTDSGSPTQNSSAVTIQNFAFAPVTLNVKVGTTVTWTNQDNVQHQIKSDSSEEVFASENLTTGQSYSFAFNKTGTFAYHCTIHPSMQGAIVVTP